VNRPAPLTGLFVTGTDTGVGKTLVAMGLLALARRRGLRPVPFKPVETGCAPDPNDARALQRAAATDLSLDAICPFPLRLPAAPSAAAAAENIRLDIHDLAELARAAAATGDVLIVEGAGGLLVPYAGAATAADLASALGLPLLVVARTALGTVNHTALTLREAARQGLAVAGLVLNRTSAEVAPHEDRNIDLIEAVTGARALGTVPFLPEPSRGDPERAADALLESLGAGTIDRLLRASGGGG
jgi:dethiobiotin synthetase